jgi:hypothetical protein
MSLLPEIHVDFGQLTFERIYQVLLPLIPGGTLVGGLVLTYPQRVHDLGLGRYSRVAVIVCSAYIAGVILYGFSVTVTGNCTILFATLLSKRSPPLRPNLVPSQSWVWRCVAGEFLGQSLSPPPLPASALPLSGNDVQWQDLYNVLQDYVLRVVPVVSNEIYLLVTHLQGTAWALFYLYWKPPLRGHWSLMVMSISLIFLGATMPFGTNFWYWKYDRLTPWDFTARLINEIKMREKSNTPAAH